MPRISFSCRSVLWVAMVWTAAFFPAAALSNDRVIVLSSFAAGDYLHEPIINGLRERLSARAGLRLTVEYLDVDHAQDARHLDQFAELLSVKHSSSEVDAVVALGGAGMQYALRWRKSIFGNAPMFFAQNANIGRAEAEALPQATGVLGGYNLVETFALVRSLHPSRRRIVVVDDGTHRNLAHRQSLDFIGRQYSGEVEIVELVGGTIDKVEAALRGLGDEDVVLYLSFTEDASGHRYDYHDALGRVARATSAPVYGVLETMAGYGVVGGYMLSLHELGWLIGGQVIEALDGADVDTIPLVGEAPHRFVFDFRQLERFRIPHRELPLSSTIINEPDTFYYRYKASIFAAIALLAALVACISVLASSLARREKARRALERLIGEGQVPLSIDRPATMLTELRERLLAVVPQVSEVDFFASPGGLTRDAVLVPLGAQAKNVPEPPLVVRAGELQHNVYGAKDALLLFKADSIPADLAYCRAQGRLDQVDQRIMDILARNVAIECQNQKAARLTSSLENAREIQDAMLPKNFGAFELDICATIRPARHVGGDLYDLFAIDRHRICIAVGDVSDKGVPAALFMSVTRTLVRALVEETLEPKVAIERANAALSADNPQSMFVTIFLAVIEPATGKMVYVNAGHNAPILRRGPGDVANLPVESNIALGASETASFVQQSILLPKGCTLVLFTDGVTEAENEWGQQFGEARFGDLIAGSTAPNAETLVEEVVVEVNKFAGGAPQSDDITVLAVFMPRDA